MGRPVNITGNGLRVLIAFSKTFPSGITIEDFPADSDPLDLGELEIGEAKMGLNGTPILFSKADPFETSISLLPTTEEAAALTQAALANRIGSKLRPLAKDIITMTVIYPDGSTRIASNGWMTKASVGPNVKGEGKMEDQKFTFQFADLDETPSLGL